MKSIFAALITTILLSGASASAATDETTAQLLRDAIAGEHRSESNRARDAYRKPFETVEFL